MLFANADVFRCCSSCLLLFVLVCFWLLSWLGFVGGVACYSMVLLWLYVCCVILALMLVLSLRVAVVVAGCCWCRCFMEMVLLPLCAVAVLCS